MKCEWEMWDAPRKYGQSGNPGNPGNLNLNPKVKVSYMENTFYGYRIILF